MQIFTFKLERVERDNLDVLKDEFESLKNFEREIQQEIAVFRYQFLTQNWSDQARQQRGRFYPENYRVEAVGHHPDSLFNQDDEQSILVK